MPPPLSTTTTVRREAMATEFSVTVAHDDQVLVRQAAAEAWRELARLEELLSHFLNYSDVARIGRARAGTSVVVDGDTYDCLQLALRVEAETDGAFNIAYRRQPPARASALLALSDVPPTVRATADHVPLDLGGIGKGYALDRIAVLLNEWALPRFLLRLASASTLLAGQSPPGSRGWPVSFGPAEDRQRVHLCRAAVSGSGSAVQGNHIVDPRSGHPASHFQSTWAAAETAALADAYSTALMAMRDDAIRRFCRRRPNCLAYVQRAGRHALESFHTESPVVYR